MIELGRRSLPAQARKSPEDVAKVLARVGKEGLLSTHKMVKDRLDAPSPLGYSCAGVVEELGEFVSGIRPGDRVACLGGAEPVEVFASGLGNGKSAALQDSLIATLTLANGAVASIAYVAEGDSGFPKERVEVFCGGAVGVIDDFNSLVFSRGGKQERTALGHTDKGHAEEMRQLVELAQGRPSHVLDAASCVASTRATLAVVESLASGRPVRLG
jgi:hypothetical protein